MPDPNYRALCAELLVLAEESISYRAQVNEAVRLIDRARAALAQPEPVAPTDEEIMELMPQQMRDDLANAARALAGFDRAPDKAVAAFRIILNRQAVKHARAAIARWGQPTIKPVPVSERPWEREGWCDENGWCWGFDADDSDPCWIFDKPESFSCWTHYLPHHALPLPTSQED